MPVANNKYSVIQGSIVSDTPHVNNIGSRVKSQKSDDCVMSFGFKNDKYDGEKFENDQKVLEKRPQTK
jgi:hypothetical protein